MPEGGSFNIDQCKLPLRQFPDLRVPRRDREPPGTVSRLNPVIPLSSWVTGTCPATPTGPKERSRAPRNCFSIKPRYPPVRSQRSASARPARLFGGEQKHREGRRPMPRPAAFEREHDTQVARKWLAKRPTSQPVIPERHHSTASPLAQTLAFPHAHNEQLSVNTRLLPKPCRPG